uniref:Uncharacterized protein n=1 Tax=Acrosorium ciliolatum TaxID=1550622 RepID=A0A1Z1M279_9FLOR|nr:hypothetical protein [Acrosorium ciliolatum]ARW59903.1 hypothetical protein [Acrosorium ciliolatum]
MNNSNLSGLKSSSNKVKLFRYFFRVFTILYVILIYSNILLFLLYINIKNLIKKNIAI